MINYNWNKKYSHFTMHVLEVINSKRRVRDVYE